MNPRNFHESYTGSEIKPPPERSTGLLFGAIAVIVAVLWHDRPFLPFVALGLAISLTVISLFAPDVLKPLNLAWLKLGSILHRIVNPLVMFAIFAFVFVPGGMIMRIWRDPLRSKRMAGASSYWIDGKEELGASADMKNQF